MGLSGDWELVRVRPPRHANDLPVVWILVAMADAYEMALVVWKLKIASMLYMFFASLWQFDSGFCGTPKLGESTGYSSGPASLKGGIDFSESNKRKPFANLSLKGVSQDSALGGFVHASAVRPIEMSLYRSDSKSKTPPREGAAGEAP